MARRKIKTTDKGNRKDDLDPSKDEFINKTLTVFDWAYDRRRPIALVLGIGLVAVILGIVADRMVESGKADAAALLSDGLQAAMAPLIPPSKDGEDSVDEKDPDFLTFENARARATETLKQFETIKGEGSSTVGMIGEIGKAAAHFDLGEYDKAIAAYKKFLASGDKSLARLRPTAREGLGLALEATGKVDEAQKQFDDLVTKTQGAAANMARYHAARLARKKDDKDRAIELFKEVVDFYGEKGKVGQLDYVFLKSREQLLELDPKAEVPALPGGGMGGLKGIDPAILQQLMQAQQAGGRPS
ncbi:MAG: tetratricopeptide repeat protein [Deltaproteobacteria bacterium]|nr:tetratricopeptide repeat protein [Deltaproteobacteria bacterium]